MFTVKRLRTALASAIAVFSFANYAKSSVLNRLVNKAIDDRRLRPGATYRATVNNLLRSRGRVQACICIWHVHYVKHDVIHKPDAHSVYHCHQRRTEPTATANTHVKFREFPTCGFRHMRTDRQTDRQTEDRNTSHLSRGQQGNN